MELLKRNHVKYGLLLDGFLAMCLLWAYVTGDYSKMQNLLAPMAIFTMLVPLVFYFLGIRAKRNELKGKLTFKQGLKEGFKISLVVGVTSPFVFLIFYLFFAPSLIEYARQAYKMVGASDTMVVTVDMLVQLVGSIIFGTLYGAIASFFLKTK
jgi:hypothetical protein